MIRFKLPSVISIATSLLALAGSAHAALNVETLWTLSPGDRTYLTTQGFQRSMDYNPVTGHLLVANAVGANTQPTIHILDAETGEDLGLLSTNGVFGGHSTFDLVRVVVAEDGTIYAGNLATNSTADSPNGFRLYRWENEESEPVVVFDGDPSLQDPVNANRRFGDWMVVRGTGEETRIVLTTWQGNIISILKPSGESEFVVDKVITALPADDPGGIPATEIHTIAFASENQVYITFRTKSLHEAEIDLEAGTLVRTRTFTVDNLPTQIQFAAVHPEMSLLATSIRQNQIRFYRIEDLTTEGQIEPAATVFFPTTNEYDHGGSMVFVGNRLYALGTNNGIMALELSESAGVSYDDWIAGFELSEDDALEQASPAGDGIPNLLKYALGLDPRIPSRGELPVPQLDAGQLTLTFEPSPEAVGIETIVEVSSDLVQWDSGPEHTAIVEEGSLVIARDNLAISEHDRRFIRLRIARP